MFNYRGFSKEELFRATDGHGVDPRYVVRSLNSNLYKLALVDESLAPRFFRQTRISDSIGTTRSHRSYEEQTDCFQRPRST